MKNITGSIIILSMALILMAPQVAAGDPVAPMVPLRADIATYLDSPQEAVDAMVKESEGRIPPGSAVGVSVPPGTLWLGGGAIGKMENALLVSALHPDEVRQYYQEKLPHMSGWKWSEEFELFWKAQGSITLERLMSFTIPTIEIEEISPDNALLSMVDSDVRKNLKTLLKITYPAN